MAIVVVGGHSRNIGKTSVVAGLIGRLPQFHWTAFKITQYGHGFCTANGEPCDCQTDDHTLAVSEERSSTSGTDTARFLASGAERSIWVRTRQGMLAEAMPRLRTELAGAQNVILESNSVMRFLRPDLYITVLDTANPDFKPSAKEYLDRADAVILHDRATQPAWGKISLKPVAAKPVFRIIPPPYVTPELIEFVWRKLAC